MIMEKQMQMYSVNTYSVVGSVRMNINTDKSNYFLGSHNETLQK